MKTFVLTLGAATAFIAACFAAPSAHADPPRDYCRYGQSASLFLIDRTTRFSAQDQQVILESLSAIVEELGPGDRIRVATIEDHYSRSDTVFDECRPGCPESGNLLGDLSTGCAGMIATADRRRFVRRLIAGVRPLLNDVVDAPHSDITGTVAQATRRPSGGRAYGRIYIFSDMLENSQALPWSSFRDMTRTQALEAVRRYQLTPSVRRADIRIAGFGRMHDAPRSPLPADLDLRLRTFWESYFTEGGARSVSFESVISR